MGFDIGYRAIVKKMPTLTQIGLWVKKKKVQRRQKISGSVLNCAL